uniref:Ig-like domain-containing protein n=1 Tax=Magallana gigas TaxID=29159 RepID=A0A8W8NNX9_MAGGI
MKKERQFLCFLIVMYPLKISCLLYALLTDYWVETDDFHFGLYKYCVDNTSTCLDVTIQLQTIEAELPSFNNVPNSLNIKSGLTLEIAINVCGYPKPKNVCWFKDGKVIERSRSVIMQYMEGDCRLLIHDTVQADSGMYECYAENAHGNNRCKIPVKVTKDDQEPISCTQVLIGVIEG